MTSVSSLQIIPPVIVKEIALFRKSGATETVLPFELCAKERKLVHEFIESLGLYSESLTQSVNGVKKIRVSQTPLPEVRITSDIVSKFAKLVQAKHPSFNPDLVEYYNQVFGLTWAWKQYLQDLPELWRTENQVREQASQQLNQLLNDVQIPRNKPMLRRGDVYHYGSIGKRFLSIDLAQGNFTAARLVQPELPPTWAEFMDQFTQLPTLIQSKQFREVIFGKTSFVRKSVRLQEAIMDVVFRALDQSLDPDNQLIKSNLCMKQGDELVYELGSAIVDITQLQAVLDNLPLQQLGFKGRPVFHVDIFSVEQVETKRYFLKRFEYSSQGKSWELKKVDKKFYLQVFKYVTGQDHDPRDLFFTDSGLEAKYTRPLFD